jgi:hypothetical protein
LHVLSGITVGVVTHFTYKFIDNRRLQKELVIWDYVKKHPEDFPEISNRMLTLIFY